MLVVLKYTFWLLSTVLAFAGAWLARFTRERSDDPSRLELTRAGRIALPVAIAALILGLGLEIAEGVAHSASAQEEQKHREELAQRLVDVQQHVSDVTEQIALVLQSSPDVARSVAGNPEAATSVGDFFDLAERVDPSLHNQIEQTRRFMSGQLLQSPVEAAVTAGSATDVNAAITEGAAVDERGDLGLTPLQLAALQGKLDVVKVLVNKGANVNARSTFNGETALMKAVMTDHREIVRYLLDHGAQVDVKDNNGSTALFHAAYFNRLQSLELLIARGADRTIINNRGETALVAAEKVGSKATAERLRRGP
jgi:uncharacterized protein